MILLDDDLPRHSPLRQVIFKSYLPSKKTYLSDTTGHRDVTKISSCWVNTISRHGIKQLGTSFGPIFLLFSDESSQGPHS